MKVLMVSMLYIAYLAIILFIVIWDCRRADIYTSDFKCLLRKGIRIFPSGFGFCVYFFLSFLFCLLFINNVAAIEAGSSLNPYVYISLFLSIFNPCFFCCIAHVMSSSKRSAALQHTIVNSFYAVEVAAAIDTLFTDSVSSDFGLTSKKLKSTGINAVYCSNTSLDRSSIDARMVGIYTVYSPVSDSELLMFAARNMAKNFLTAIYTSRTDFLKEANEGSDICFTSLSSCPDSFKDDPTIVIFNDAADNSHCPLMMLASFIDLCRNAITLLAVSVAVCMIIGLFSQLVIGMLMLFESSNALISAVPLVEFLLSYLLSRVIVKNIR